MFKKLINLIVILLFKSGTNNIRIYIARKLGVKIGEECRIFPCSFGSEPYLISIGNHCEITYGVSFVTHDGATWIFRKNNKFEGSKFGPIIIKDNCMIGIYSIILPDVEIGPNSIVGAGSIVTKNVPQNAVYAGNPARYICSVDEYLEKCKITDTGKIQPADQKKILMEMFEKRINK